MRKAPHNLKPARAIVAAVKDYLDPETPLHAILIGLALLEMTRRQPADLYDLIDDIVGGDRNLREDEIQPLINTIAAYQRELYGAFFKEKVDA